eukprot:CAMPEP_0197659264 /NCGR_PEP_ID=MMETSP1338-20131121/46928_1 /TAXON_ID=43686 ORGANISM="Pelagodinium beii, Strain RCC1491" /NCGR_SAMPLE_ID=MMETSP1338 /ASSEMBLY_ACC=CAM_ASM_000754 /LENGTH=412 /DNA_ID=CAMNT_0043236107 /DNA_START=61 /DNA_END=1299 /DNA_ORIENTATION=+
MSVADDDSVVVDLHKRETSGSGYWGHPGICTVTFCEGDPQKALEALRRRLRAVLDDNPWVAGQLDKKKRLVHPKSCSDEHVNQIISSKKCAAVSRSTVYPKLVEATGMNPELAVQKGALIQKMGARITKLVVVEPEQAGGEFAIVFSMTHVAADGHDYYKIYNMIAGDAKVESMSPKRISEYEAREPEWTGKKDFAWISGGAGLVKGMLTGLAFGPKSKWCCYFVDQDKVNAKKTAAAKEDGVKFVSTNDVLTSHFCNAAAARVCMMVINMRDKISVKVSDMDAGCYEGCLLLDPENYADPSKIRACIAAGAPYTRQTPSPPLPGLCGSCPMALITSWASFDFELSLEGVNQVLHLPCMDMPDVMDVAVVFKPKPGKLGMLYMAKRSTPAKLKAADTVLGDTVDGDIFPVSE